MGVSQLVGVALQTLPPLWPGVLMGVPVSLALFAVIVTPGIGLRATVI